MTSPSPAEIRQARKAAGLTQAAAAALVGVNDRGWRRYEAGDVKMPAFKYGIFLERIERIGKMK
jgi:transcriptional regulator with XRE-family HTH domain